MNFKKHMVIGSLVPSLLILSGCSNEAESIDELVEDMNTQSTVIVTELNDLTNLEGDVQAAFGETLNEDEELITFEDGSSPVFENIQSREDGLEEIIVNLDTMSETNASLKEIELSEIDTDVIQGYIEATDSLLSTVDDYVEQYQTVLDEDRDYFESLSSEDASYQTFSDGIEEINSLHMSLQESYTSIDNQLEEFYVEESAVDTVVNELLNDE